MQPTIQVALALVVFQLSAALIVGAAAPQDVKVLIKTLPKFANPPTAAKLQWAKVVQKFKTANRPEGVARQVIGGKNATLGQFPWQAYMYIDNSYICGGSLVYNRLLLTAAHCVTGYSRFEVYLGSINRLATNEPSRQIVVTNKTYIHQQYDPSTLRNDIAIVKLSPSVVYNENVQRIMVPDANLVNTFAGVTAHTSGFGRTASRAVANTLQFTTMTVLSNQDCAAYYGSYIFPSTLCTLATTSNTICHGDSGGPLVYRADAKSPWMIIGVTSFTSGQGCGTGPAGFSRVLYYASWIGQVAMADQWGQDPFAA